MAGNNECVYVGFGGGRVAVCDSKDPYGPMLVFDSAEWAAFVRCVVTGKR